jgi:hypothetical protein
MRNYGSIQTLDVYADGGASSVSITPGATVQQAEFTVQAPKAGVDGNWPLAMNIMVKTSIVVDQPASGGSTLEPDETTVVIDSYNVNSPLLGLTHPRDTYTGPIAKNIAEFFSAGYTSSDGARIQVPAADGDTTLVLYQLLPFAQENFNRPHHFAPWLGWLNATKIQAYIAASTAIASFSTGAVTEAPCTVSCWIEYVVSSELIMPAFAQYHLYETPASGGTTAIVQGIGTQNGMADVKDGSRIAALLELMNVNGMGGATTANIYTSVTIPQLGLDLTFNIDSFFSAFRRAMGGHRGSIALSVTEPVTDRAGAPYIVATDVLTDLNAAGALYIPWRAVGRNQQITKLVRFFGDLKVTRSFSSTPSSGKYRFVTCELREFGDAKKKEMVGKTGKSGYKLERIFENGTPDGADLERHKNKVRSLPERVIFT